MCHADHQPGRVPRPVQGSHAAAAGLDVHGLDPDGLAQRLPPPDSHPRLSRGQALAARGGPRHGGHVRGGHRELHRRARRAHQGPPPDPVRREEVRPAVLGSHRLPHQDLPPPRCAGSLPRPVGDAHLPVLLLLLVEQLRHLLALDAGPHEHEHSRHQLLGGRVERAGLLAHQLPERPGEAAHHDRPAGQGAGRRRAQVLQVDGRGQDRVQRVWAQGLLEGVPAVLPAGIPGERNGIASVGGCDEDSLGE